MWFCLKLCCFLYLIQFFAKTDDVPSVFIAILIRNKAHSLPYFFTLLSQIDYAKNKLIIWIRSDHNEDHTALILNEWYNAYNSHYKAVDMMIDYWPNKLINEINIAQWTESRFLHVINLRETALNTAKNSSADYIWFLDCDSFITNKETLRNLVNKKRTVVAPMLLSDSLYSNFWCGMTSDYYYERTEEYEKILKRKYIGCFSVPMVHSAVLINLKSKLANFLTFLPNKVNNYNGPIDDIIIFAIGANKSDIPLYVCNDINYGYTTVPLNDNQNIDDDRSLLTNLKLFITVNESPLPVDDLFIPYIHYPSKSKYTFDQIYVINLVRRKERKNRMMYCLQELGLDAVFIEAVDGKQLNNEMMNEMNISFMPGYEDPFHKRPMKMGEIGCFLSHYNIWKEIVDRNLSKVMILEDDLHFEKFFINSLKELISEINQPSLIWDLIYLGRKILKPEEEIFIEGSSKLVQPHYSYWTLGYILNLNGAKKLLNAFPLQNLIPVDEFLPIMYDKHPRDDWKAFFPIRNIIALSINPLIIFPMKYVNEEEYISDTEDSFIIDNSIHSEL